MDDMNALGHAVLSFGVFFFLAGGWGGVPAPMVACGSSWAGDDIQTPAVT